jgi:hypothetical protein
MRHHNVFIVIIAVAAFVLFATFVRRSARRGRPLPGSDQEEAERRARSLEGARMIGQTAVSFRGGGLSRRAAAVKRLIS